MNSLLVPADLQLCRLSMADIDDILAIEERVYAHPWSRGNFSDSFINQDLAFGLRDQAGQLRAYFILMAVVDEAHILTIAVDQPWQAQGYARCLLVCIEQITQSENMQGVLLEVRRSNQRAQKVYLAAGYQEIGQRRAYYPCENGREDAIVMRKTLSGGGA